MRALSLALLAVLGLGCATGQVNQARTGIVAGVHVFSVGAEALEAARQAEEASLLSQVESGAMSPDQAEDEYRAFMLKAQKAAKALILLWDAIKAASHVIDAADAKMAGNLPAAMSDVLAALSDAVKALKAVGVKVPGVN